MANNIWDKIILALNLYYCVITDGMKQLIKRRRKRKISLNAKKSNADSR